MHYDAPRHGCTREALCILDERCLGESPRASVLANTHIYTIQQHVALFGFRRSKECCYCEDGLVCQIRVYSSLTPYP